jgi:hypothetical protein
MAWFFSAWVIGWYVFSVEAALFAPSAWHVLTDILMPVRMAVVAWAVLSAMLVLEYATKKPFQPHELLLSAVSFRLSLPSTYTLLFTELGGGAYWSLASKLDLAPRALIGLVFGLGWLYVERNERLINSPDLINMDPYGAGWIVVIKASRPNSELKDFLTDGEYVRFIKQSERKL